MYDDFKVANYPKSVVSPELYARHLARLFTGDVIDGFTVSPGTGLQVVLAPGNALIRYGSGAVASAREVSLVNNFNLAIGPPDASNPRIDLVVVYVDNGVSLPSGTPSAANLDGKGVAKAKIVPGTPAATPAAPNATAIQASVVAGNPYTVVAQVRVDNGVNVIANGKITDIRSMAKVGYDKIDLPTLIYSAFKPGTTSTTSNSAAYTPVNINGGLSVSVPVVAGKTYRVMISASYVAAPNGEVGISTKNPDTNADMATSTTLSGGGLPISAVFEYIAGSTGTKTFQFRVQAQAVSAPIRTDNARIEISPLN